MLWSAAAANAGGHICGKIYSITGGHGRRGKLGIKIEKYSCASCSFSSGPLTSHLVPDKATHELELYAMCLRNLLLPGLLCNLGVLQHGRLQRDFLRICCIFQIFSNGE